jgi:diguanylate cyclase (GGDEF)-like protein
MHPDSQEQGSSAERVDDVRAAEVPLHRCVVLVLAIVFVVELTVTLCLGFAPEGALSRRAEGAVNAALLAIICYPLLWAYLVRPLRRAINADRGSILDYQGRIVEQSRQRELESRLHSALEMADDEATVLEVASIAMREVLPDEGYELLLADNSRAHLRQAISKPGVVEGPPGCGVEAPMACPAVRTGKVMQFDDSESMDACPKLRGRVSGGCGALCVPVTVGGRAIGVIHTPRPLGANLPPETPSSLELVANQAGARIGMVRVLAKTQLQAATDPLTGLLNRRSLETKACEVCKDGTGFAVVACDLDHFKKLNDRHGHEAGDRALRVFSTTLQDTVRPGDLVARLGGEEFALVLPGATEVDACAVAGRVRQRLATALGRGSVPAFTASFGVADSSHGPRISDVMPVADHALYAAKRGGRNRVVPASVASEAADVSLADTSGRDRDTASSSADNDSDGSLDGSRDADLRKDAARDSTGFAPAKDAPSTERLPQPTEPSDVSDAAIVGSPALDPAAGSERVAFSFDPSAGELFCDARARSLPDAQSGPCNDELAFEPDVQPESQQTQVMIEIDFGLDDEPEEVEAPAPAPAHGTGEDDTTDEGSEPQGITSAADDAATSDLENVSPIEGPELIGMEPHADIDDPEIADPIQDQDVTEDEAADRAESPRQDSLEPRGELDELPEPEELELLDELQELEELTEQVESEQLEQMTESVEPEELTGRDDGEVLEVLPELEELEEPTEPEEPIEDQAFDESNPAEAQEDAEGPGPEDSREACGDGEASDSGDDARADEEHDLGVEEPAAGEPDAADLDGETSETSPESPIGDDAADAEDSTAESISDSAGEAADDDAPSASAASSDADATGVPDDDSTTDRDSPGGELSADDVSDSQAISSDEPEPEPEPTKAEAPEPSAQQPAADKTEAAKPAKPEKTGGAHKLAEAIAAAVAEGIQEDLTDEPELDAEPAAEPQATKPAARSFFLPSSAKRKPATKQAARKAKATKKA